MFTIVLAQNWTQRKRHCLERTFHFSNGKLRVRLKGYLKGVSSLSYVSLILSIYLFLFFFSFPPCELCLAFQTTSLKETTHPNFASSCNSGEFSLLSFAYSYSCSTWQKVNWNLFPCSANLCGEKYTGLDCGSFEWYRTNISKLCILE